MAHFSFSSVYMTVIASNLLLVALVLCLRSDRFMVKVGYRLLTFFAWCTLLRFLIPLEFPFSVNILLPKPLSFLIAKMHWPLFTVLGHQITVWVLLCVVWIGVFLVRLVRGSLEQFRDNRMILSLTTDITGEEPFRSTMARVCRERRRRNTFRILRIDGIPSPMLFGVFRPKILIPAHMEFTEEDLYFVLSHEASHHFHHDLVTKQLVRLITMFYWWNPFCHLLAKRVDAVLEMRVDGTIARAGDDVSARYLNCLIRLMEQSVADANDPDDPIAPDCVLQAASDESQMFQRFTMLTQTKKQRRALSAAMFVLIAGVYLLSYVFIFEAHYMSKSVREEITEITSENTYAIQMQDGHYEIYFHDSLIDSADTLDYYGPDIPIYQYEDKEQAHEEE